MNERKFVIRELLRVPSTPTGGETLRVVFHTTNNDRYRKTIFLAGDRFSIDNLMAILEEHIARDVDPAELERLRKDAERYRWLREHFRFANDSMRELWFDPSLEPDDSGVPCDLDAAIDAAMTKEPRDGR